MGHADEQLLEQSLSLTAPGAASLLLQQVPVVLQQESLETAPMVAESSFAWLLLQPASKLSRAAAARVVRVRVMVGNSSECFRNLDLASNRGFSTVGTRSRGLVHHRPSVQE